MTNEWDLASAILETDQPTDEVVVYLNAKASFAKDKLLKQQAITTDEAILADIEKALAEADEMLAKSKYTFFLTAVPSRMREDIHSMALSRFPIKPVTMLGQDDAANAQARQRVENILIWLAQVTAIENPTGLRNTEFDEESLTKFYDALSDVAKNAVSKAIAELTKASERFTAESQNPDFSLKP